MLVHHGGLQYCRCWLNKLLYPLIFTMAEDQSNKEEEALGSLKQARSLNQARVLAFRHARDNRDFYEPPCSRWPRHALDKETTT